MESVQEPQLIYYHDQKRTASKCLCVPAKTKEIFLFPNVTTTSANYVLPLHLSMICPILNKPHAIYEQFLPHLTDLRFSKLGHPSLFLVFLPGTVVILHSTHHRYAIYSFAFKKKTNFDLFPTATLKYPLNKDVINMHVHAYHFYVLFRVLCNCLVKQMNICKGLNTNHWGLHLMTEKDRRLVKIKRSVNK